MKFDVAVRLRRILKQHLHEFPNDISREIDSLVSQLDDDLLQKKVQDFIEQRRLDKIMLDNSELRTILHEALHLACPWLADEKLGLSEAELEKINPRRKLNMYDGFTRESLMKMALDYRRRKARIPTDLETLLVKEELLLPEDKSGENGAVPSAPAERNKSSTSNEEPKLDRGIETTVAEVPITEEASSSTKATTQPQKEKTKEKKKGSVVQPAYNPNWLIHYLRESGTGSAEDFASHRYEGWMIPSPRVCLIRIRNFLSDEDVDRKIGWKQKLDAIAKYLAHLTAEYEREPARRKPSWALDLHDALVAFKVHQTFENYHYGTPTGINMNFDLTSKSVSKRLPPPRDVQTEEVRKRKKVDRGLSEPRQLLHREVTGAIDKLYGIPQPFLKDAFLEEFRRDERLLWTNDEPFHRSIKGSKDKHNLADVEDQAFIEGIQAGPGGTSSNLLGPHSFSFDENAMTGKAAATTSASSTTTTRTKKPTGRFAKASAAARREEQLQQFARFRGANRAGLTAMLRFVGGMQKESAAVATPWRQVVLPPDHSPPPNEVGGDFDDRPPAKLRYQVHHLHETPDPHDLEPMAWSFWHEKLLKTESEAVEALAVSRREADANLDPVSRRRRQLHTVHPPTKNYNGPFVPTSVDRKRQAEDALLKRIEGIVLGLQTAHRMAPREATGLCLNEIETGRIRDSDQPISEPLGDANSPDLEILEALCKPSLNREMLNPLHEGSDPEALILADRLAELLDSRSPTSIFRNPSCEVSEEDLCMALNQGAMGPIQRIWIPQDVMHDMLAELGAKQRITVMEKKGSGGNTTTWYKRPPTDLHPEQLMDWIGSDDKDDKEDPSRWRLHHLTYERVVAQDTKTLATKHARNLAALGARARRVGVTLRSLQSRHTTSKTTATMPDERRRRLVSASRRSRAQWERDVARHRHHAAAAESGSGSIAMTASEVVRRVDPSAYSQLVRDGGDGVEPATSIISSSGFVREGLVHESCRSATMLFPSRTAVVTVRRDPNTGGGSGGEELVLCQVARRDASPWTWGRPEVRGKCGRFFALDRWPVHLQSEEKQRDIRGSGPVTTFEDPPPLPEAAQNSPKLIPLWDPEVNNFRHRYGKQTFFQGDTPAQRRYMKAGFANAAREQFGLPLEPMPDPDEPDPFRLVHHEDVIGKPRIWNAPPSPPSPRRPAPPGILSRLRARLFGAAPAAQMQQEVPPAIARLFEQEEAKRDKMVSRSKESSSGNSRKRAQERGPAWIEKKLREVRAETREWEERATARRRAAEAVGGQQQHGAADDDGHDVEMGDADLEETITPPPVAPVMNRPAGSNNQRGKGPMAHQIPANNRFGGDGVMEVYSHGRESSDDADSMEGVQDEMPTPNAQLRREVVAAGRAAQRQLESFSEADRTESSRESSEPDGLFEGSTGDIDDWIE